MLDVVCFGLYSLAVVGQLAEIIGFLGVFVEMVRVVADTNVLVSAFIVREKYRRLVHKLLDGYNVEVQVLVGATTASSSLSFINSF
jgi:hypothetical protein